MGKAKKVHKRGADYSSASSTREECRGTAHPTQSRTHLSLGSGFLWKRKKYGESVTQIVVEGHTKTWSKEERKWEIFLESEDRFICRYIF